MKPASHAVIAVSAMLLMLVSGCSEQDKAISVARGDAEMEAAMAEARATLPKFWQAFAKREGGETDFALKVKLGDRIDIPEADISDWLYIRNGKMVGNRTLKPLFKQMPADEVERIKKIMVEP